jgi:hypothetical protein
MPAVSLMENGTYHFEKIDSNTHDKSIIDGKHYSDKAPLPTVLFIPFAVALEKTGIISLTDSNYPGLYAWSGFLFGTIPFLMIILLTYRRAEQLYQDKFDILFLILPWFGSFLFAYSASMYSHVFAGLLLIFAYNLLQKEQFLLSGLVIGAVFVTEYPLAIVGLIWGIQIWIKKGFKPAFLFGLGVSPFLVLIGLYNWVIAGNAFTLLYKYVDPNYAFMHKDYGFGVPSIQVSLQILFGQYKGILVYCPVFAIVLFVGLSAWLKRNNKLRNLFLDPIVVPFIGGVLLISSYEMWWGGWAFGMRHMIAYLILLLYYYLPILATNGLKKVVTYPFLFIGLIIGLLNKTTSIYSIPSEIDYPLWNISKDFAIQPDLNPNNLLTYFFHIQTRTAAYIFIGLFILGLLILKWRESRNPKKLHNP